MSENDHEQLTALLWPEKSVEERAAMKWPTVIRDLEGLKYFASRCLICDSAFTDMHLAIERVRSHFDETGKVRGDGKWRQDGIAKSLAEVNAIWRKAVCELNALDAAMPARPDRERLNIDPASRSSELEKTINGH